MKPVISTPRAEVYCAGFEDVAPTLADGLATLAILDGPYNMRKAEWDKFPSWDHFREWYAPHLEQVSRILAPSANLYVWGTDDSASALRELVGSMGWTRRTRIIWDKGNPANLMGWAAAGWWPVAVEVCDHYQRGLPTFRLGGPTANVWHLTPKAFEVERLRTGRRSTAKAAEDRRTADVKLCGPYREALHECQKPLAFYDRLIRSSSRPGDVVLEPFGGTLRAAVACQRLPASEARRAICVEPDAKYIEAVRPSLEFQPVGTAGQPSLFGGEA